MSDCFGVSVASKYDEDYSQFTPEFADLLGQGSPNLFGVMKTHDLPEDDGPAIYIVRDGRASIVSYFHFCRDFEFPRTMADIIVGKTPFGSWSDHLRRWAPSRRAGTLLLRYEDITARPDDAVEQLAAFLNQRPQQRFTHDFSRMHDCAPRFFRSGSNARNISELTEAELEMFDALHGETMSRYGYYAPSAKMQELQLELQLP